MANAQTQLLTITKDTVTVNVPRELRLSSSKKNTVIGGYKRAMQTVVDGVIYTVSVNVYRKPTEDELKSLKAE